MTDAERQAALEAIASEVRACNRCRLHQGRSNAVPGEGSASTEVLFVGEGPGFNEDRQGRPFVGRAGQKLTEWIESIGWRRQDVFITNIVKCRPPDNRDPLPDEIAACTPFLRRQIEALDPAIVVTLGRFSMGWFTPGTRISQVHGTARLADPATGAPQATAYAMYHPAAALRSPEVDRQAADDMVGVPMALVSARERRAGAQVETTAETNVETTAETNVETTAETKALGGGFGLVEPVDTSRVEPRDEARAATTSAEVPPPIDTALGDALRPESGVDDATADGATTAHGAETADRAAEMADRAAELPLPTADPDETQLTGTLEPDMPEPDLQRVAVLDAATLDPPDAMRAAAPDMPTPHGGETTDSPDTPAPGLATPISDEATALAPMPAPATNAPQPDAVSWGRYTTGTSAPDSSSVPSPMSPAAQAPGPWADDVPSEQLTLF